VNNIKGFTQTQGDKTKQKWDQKFCIKNWSHSVPVFFATTKILIYQVVFEGGGIFVLAERRKNIFKLKIFIFFLFFFI